MNAEVWFLIGLKVRIDFTKTKKRKEKIIYTIIEKLIITIRFISFFFLIC